jgi:hypothetical protein
METKLLLAKNLEDARMACEVYGLNPNDFVPISELKDLLGYVVGTKVFVYSTARLRPDFSKFMDTIKDCEYTTHTLRELLK